ncbi:hypothetical protein CEQ28_013665 [Hafnia alvei]|nr:hypothetical protein CEQ28_013665 [Hafnia alvei]
MSEVIMYYLIQHSNRGHVVDALNKFISITLYKLKWKSVGNTVYFKCSGNSTKVLESVLSNRGIVFNKVDERTFDKLNALMNSGR